ncbi:MAG: hypothetical protein ABIH37_04745 [archaeon]
MIAKREPDVLLRAGNIEGDLLRKINSCEYEFETVPTLTPNIESYCYYLAKKNQLFTIMRIPLPHLFGYNYNTEFVVTSYSQKQNKRLLREFQERTGIEMQSVNMPRPVTMKGVRNLFYFVQEYGLERAKQEMQRFNKFLRENMD